MTETEQKKLKDKIITSLYQSKEVEKKIDGILYRNHVSKDTDIHRDILQETFYWICRRPATEIIEMHEDDVQRNDGKSRILGLAVRIAVLKGVASNKNDPAYPKHSLLKSILWTSCFNQLQHVSSTECQEKGNDFSKTLADESDQVDNNQEMWNTIRSELNEEELSFLEFFIHHKKKQGRYKKEIKNQYENLLERIEEIIIKHKFII